MQKNHVCSPASEGPHARRSRASAALVVAVLALLPGCFALDVGGDPYDPRSRAAAGGVTNTPAQLAELAETLVERASDRIQIGSIRAVVEEFVETEGETPRHRHAILQERADRAAIDTIRHELTLALGNRMNVVDPDALLGERKSRDEVRRATGATHAVVGSWYRVGDDIDVSVRLVDLRDGWIVATAEKRILDFEGRIMSVSSPSRAGQRTATERPAKPPTALERLVVVEGDTGNDADQIAPAGSAADPVRAAADAVGDTSVDPVLDPSADPTTGRSSGAVADPFAGSEIPPDFDPAEALGSEAAGPGAARLRGRAGGSQPPQ